MRVLRIKHNVPLGNAWAGQSITNAANEAHKTLTRLARYWPDPGSVSFIHQGVEVLVYLNDTPETVRNRWLGLRHAEQQETRHEEEQYVPKHRRNVCPFSSCRILSLHGHGTDVFYEGRGVRRG